MTSIIGTLRKITAQKKLLISVEQDQYNRLLKNVCAVATDANFKRPGYTIEADGETLYFITVSLDKYDRENLPKFERLRKKRVVIHGKLSNWSFAPEGKTLSGCSFTLTTIYVTKDQLELEKSIDEDVKKMFPTSDDLSEVVDDEIEAYVDQQALKAIAAMQ